MFPADGQLAEADTLGQNDNGMTGVVEARPSSIVDLCGSSCTLSAGVGEESAGMDPVGVGNGGTGQAVNSGPSALPAVFELNERPDASKEVIPSPTDGPSADGTKGIAPVLKAPANMPDGMEFADPVLAAAEAAGNGDGSADQDLRGTTGKSEFDAAPRAEARSDEGASNEAEPVVEEKSTMEVAKQKEAYANPRQGVQEERTEERNKGKKRKKKDPSAPKQPISAFLYFRAEKYPGVANQLKTSNPDAFSVTLASKTLGQMWKNMDDDAKAPYVQQARNDRERYEQQRTEYERRAGHAVGEPKKRMTPSPKGTTEPQMFLDTKAAGSNATATRSRKLRRSDIGPLLEKRELLVFWLDEFNDWFRAKVESYHKRRSIVQLHYPDDNHREALELHELKQLMGENRVKIVLDDDESDGDDGSGSDGLDTDLDERAGPGSIHSRVANDRRGIACWSDDESGDDSGDESGDDSGDDRGDDRGDERTESGAERRGPRTKHACETTQAVDPHLTQHYELSIMKDQSSKFEALKHIVLGEYFCVDSISLGKAGSAFDWHDPQTGVKFARHDPIENLLDDMIVGSALVYRVKNWQLSSGSDSE